MRKGLWMVLSAAFYLAIFFGPIGGILYYLAKVWRLDNEGLVAEGVVIHGEVGSGPDNSIYCGERILFEDAKGKSHVVTRACDTDPNIGEKVRVHYDAVDPSSAHVEGDSNVYGIVFFAAVALFIVFCVWFVSAIGHGVGWS